MSNATPDCFFITFDADGHTLAVNRVRSPSRVRALVGAVLGGRFEMHSDRTIEYGCRETADLLGVGEIYSAGQIEDGEYVREVKWGITARTPRDELPVRVAAEEVAPAGETDVSYVLAIAMARVALQRETVRALLVADTLVDVE